MVRLLPVAWSYRSALAEPFPTWSHTMKACKLIPLLSATALLCACANIVGPSSADIAALPIVDFGQAKPTGEFVLRYPAGVDLPIVARVDGTLLDKTDRATLNVRVKRDIYVYRDQASLDGKVWQAAHALIGGHYRISTPG